MTISLKVKTPLASGVLTQERLPAGKLEFGELKPIVEGYSKQ
jgi:hypothetical protein